MLIHCKHACFVLYFGKYNENIVSSSPDNYPVIILYLYMTVLCIYSCNIVIITEIKQIII